MQSFQLFLVVKYSDIQNISFEQNLKVKSIFYESWSSWLFDVFIFANRELIRGDYSDVITGRFQSSIGSISSGLKIELCTSWNCGLISGCTSSPGSMDVDDSRSSVDVNCFQPSGCATCVENDKNGDS